MPHDPLFPEILSLHGRWRAHQPALITPDETLDWQTLDRRANQVANGLAAAGCGPGSRVGVVMSNSAAFVEVMLGAVKAGAAVAPLNTAVTDAALESMLANADVGAIAATREHVPRLSKPASVAGLRLAASGESETSLPENWIDFASWRSRQHAEEPKIPLGPNDLFSLIYSSGTTGQPKGIAHSHGARLAWARDLALALRYNDACRTLVATGLYSNISWASMLPTLLLGGSLFVRPTFDARDVLETIQRERITHMSMVPVQYQRILNHPDFGAFDLSSMRAMMCCGAPLPVRDKQALFDAFSCGVIELYGLTEGLITTLAPEDAPGRLSSVGKPLPGEDIAIIDEAENIVHRGGTGEIIARSRFAMEGYWRNDEATREAFWHDPDRRAWLRSGDIGRLDAEGFLHVTDRKKDMIISGGQNIYPADIEAVLIRHPSVADCAVFGIPSERWGETPLGLVVLCEGAGAGAAEILEWANRQLGKQQRLQAVELRPSLPRNPNGKLLKRDLREPYWSPAMASVERQRR